MSYTNVKGATTLKQNIKRTIPAQTVVEETAEYKIIWDRFAGDFTALLTDIGPIGFCRTKDEARKLISDYRFETLKRAA